MHSDYSFRSLEPMYRLRICFVLMILASASAIADDDYKVGSFFNANGKMWKAIDRVEKLLVLVVITDTVNYANMEGRCSTNPKLPLGLTREEISKVVDDFYAGDSNDFIPLIFVMDFVRLKSLGATETQLRTLESELRTKANRYLK